MDNIRISLYSRFMTYNEFRSLLNAANAPVIVDVWAPWCGPCKMMKPVFDRLADEFAGRARVVALNADESPEVAGALRIHAIPTVLVFRAGKEEARRMGALGEADLRALFEAAVDGRPLPAVSNRARVARIVGAVAAYVAAGAVEPAWILQTVAVLLFAWAIHDRCPIIGALKGLIPGQRME